MWGFAVPMVFIELFDKTLLPAALYAFSSKVGCVLLGSYMGSLIDRSQRLPLIRWSLVAQNVCVLISSILLFLLYPLKGDVVPYGDPKFISLFIGLNLLGFVGALASQVEDVAVSKDWVIILCSRDPELLVKTNSTMRRINLVCEIGGPLLFGLLLTFLSVKEALIFVMVWNVVSFFPEYFTLHSIYKRKKELVKSEEELSQRNLSKPNPFLTAIKGWKEWKEHKVFWASLSYVMLYITVLSPGALMTVIKKKPRYCLLFSQFRKF